MAHSLHSANVQHYWWMNRFCAYLDAYELLKSVCMCASRILAPLLNMIWHCTTVSPHLSYTCASVCVYSSMTRGSDRCCKHKHESLEDRPATQAGNTHFVLKVNRCITSHLGLLETRTILFPSEGFGHSWATTWESISHCYDWLANDIAPFK